MSDPSQSHISHQAFGSRVVGLIPAAGNAMRLQPLPFSKELFPVGFNWYDKPEFIHPKPVCISLLEKMKFAGAKEAYIVIRHGKWDIPSYLSDGSMLDMHFAYLMMDLPYGVPYTLDQAYPFIKNELILFGFPDILFSPFDSFKKLLKKQRDSSADIVLGLFPVSNPGHMDEVEVNQEGNVFRIHIKPVAAVSPHTWIIAAWNPTFTHFLHEYVIQRLKHGLSNPNSGEVWFSDVMNAAIQNNLTVEPLLFPEGTCRDIGIPDNLRKTLSEYTKLDSHGGPVI